MRHWVQTSFHPVTLTFKIRGDGSRSSRALLRGCLATGKPQLFSSHSLLFFVMNKTLAFLRAHTETWARCNTTMNRADESCGCSAFIYVLLLYFYLDIIHYATPAMNPSSQCSLLPYTNPKTNPNSILTSAIKPSPNPQTEVWSYWVQNAPTLQRWPHLQSDDISNHYIVNESEQGGFELLPKDEERLFYHLRHVLDLFYPQTRNVASYQHERRVVQGTFYVKVF